MADAAPENKKLVVFWPKKKIMTKKFHYSEKKFYGAKFL